MRFIECVGCGYTEAVKLHESNNTEIRLKLESMIDNGWRYSPNYKGFVCPNCKGDKLLTMYQGKIRKSNKKNSLEELIKDINWHLMMMP